MPTEIKCERMDEWDFDHCIECKRFINIALPLDIDVIPAMLKPSNQVT